MEQSQDRYRQELPPAPQPHYHQGQPSQSSQHFDQQHSSYYQQPISPHDSQPASPGEYNLSSQSTQPQFGPTETGPPPSSSHSKTKSKSRSFSIHSDKDKDKDQDFNHSHKRTFSKQELEETHAEKETRRLHTKADPTLAMNEAEPAVIAAMQESRLSTLRDMQHRDSFGNPIADPDRSNPTRNRWERPLDTIRSFEAAIDGAYSRKSIVRAETDSVANWNRRSSYHQGPQPRNRPDSYYGSRPQSLRPTDNGPYVLGVAPGVQHSQTARSSIYDNRGHFDEYTGGYMPAPPRRAPNRSITEPHHGYGREQNVYHLAHKDRSYETVTTAEGSGHSDQVGYQTDPTSSDNSSIERRSPARRPEPPNEYGIGFSQSQGPQKLQMGGNLAPPIPPHAQQGAQPPINRKAAPTVLRRPTQSSQQSQMPQQQPSEQAPVADKRKSWFSRRFSKNG